VVVGLAVGVFLAAAYGGMSRWIARRRETDMPTGMTFYPSDNATARDPRVASKPGVLLASYTWAMPARRLVAGSRRETAERVVRDLSEVHPPLAGRGVSVDYVVWDWDAHRWSAGAFPWIMPGQHTELYRHIIEPEGLVFIAGEHCSLAHIWMQGAIESGLRAVSELLRVG
jgi:monoamine oxidase